MDAEDFDRKARMVIGEKLAELRLLSFRDASELPGAVASDVLVAEKEVQLTIFRQIQPIGLADAVLVTVQIARAGLGGLISYHCERALVYSPDGEIREATKGELLATGG